MRPARYLITIPVMLLLLLAPCTASPPAGNVPLQEQEQLLSRAEHYRSLASRSEKLAKEYRSKAASARKEAEYHYSYAMELRDSGKENGYHHEMSLYKSYRDQELEFLRLEKKERNLARHYRGLADQYKETR